MLEMEDPIITVVDPEGLIVTSPPASRANVAKTFNC